MTTRSACQVIVRYGVKWIVDGVASHLLLSMPSGRCCRHVSSVDCSDPRLGKYPIAIFFAKMNHQVPVIDKEKGTGGQFGLGCRGLGLLGFGGQPRGWALTTIRFDRMAPAWGIPLPRFFAGLFDLHSFIKET